MALVIIVEDGTGLANANSLASVVQADAYHEGNFWGAAWAVKGNTDKEKLLVSATRFIEARMVWAGDRVSGVQALSWPREAVFVDGQLIPDNAVPLGVADAVADLALRISIEDLTAEQMIDLVKSLGLGDGALEVEFKDGVQRDRIPENTMMMLSRYGASTGTSSGFVRVKRS